MTGGEKKGTSGRAWGTGTACSTPPTSRIPPTNTSRPGTRRDTFSIHPVGREGLAGRSVRPLSEVGRDETVMTTPQDPSAKEGFGMERLNIVPFFTYSDRIGWMK